MKRRLQRQRYLKGLFIIQILFLFAACGKDNTVLTAEDGFMDFDFIIYPEMDSTFEAGFMITDISSSMQLSVDPDQFRTVELAEAQYTLHYEHLTEQRVSATVYLSRQDSSDMKEFGKIPEQKLFNSNGKDQPFTMNTEGLVYFLELLKTHPHQFRIYLKGLSQPVSDLPSMFICSFRLRIRLTL
jgi:hypothetical protein